MEFMKIIHAKINMALVGAPHTWSYDLLIDLIDWLGYHTWFIYPVLRHACYYFFIMH